jgi:hypothetical protein
MHEMEGPYVLPGTSHGWLKAFTHPPASRFRPLQGEAGTVIVLSGILIAPDCRVLPIRDP